MDDGIPLSAVLEGPDQGRGPLVIFLHGFTSSKDRPHNVACCRAMREAGFFTMRADLYGHGESGGEFKKHTLYKWLSNTLALIDDVRKMDRVEEIWLSGHSQGGLAAALAAGMEPDRVRGLILRAPAFMIPRAAREGNMLGRCFDPERIPDEFEVGEGLVLEGNYIRAAQTIRAEEAIDRFPGPVLLIHGDADDVVPPEDSRAAARRYRRCRLEIIPGETHHFDRFPETTGNLIREWLKETREKA